MATLNNSNIVNGNTIQPNDLLQLYDAFDYAGASTKYDVTLSGSLTGNATTATTATTATSASNITTATTGSGVYYPVVVSEVGTKPPKLVSTFELSGSVLNNITASHAITASYALNSAPQTPLYSNITINNSTYAPGSDYQIDSNSSDILFIDNAGGSVGFSFDTGTEGQMIKFTTAFNAPAIDLTNISITASSSPVNFLNNNKIPITPPTNMNTMNSVFTAPGSILWSFDFYYTGGEWYLITPFAQ